MVGVVGNLLDEGFLGLVDEDDRRLEETTHLVCSRLVRGQKKDKYIFDCFTLHLKSKSLAFLSCTQMAENQTRE